MIGKRYKFKPLKDSVYDNNRAMQAVAMLVDGAFTITRVATNNFNRIVKGVAEIKLEDGTVLSHKSREIENCFTYAVWCIMTGDQLAAFCDEVVDEVIEEKEAFEPESSEKHLANDQWVVMTLNTEGGARTYSPRASQGEAVEFAKRQKLAAALSVKVYILAPVAEITLDVNVVNL